MAQNIGLNERIFRILASFVFAYLTVTHNPWWSIPALLSFVTGVVGWSPIYTLLKINTNKAGSGIKSLEKNKKGTKTSKKKKK